MKFVKYWNEFNVQIVGSLRTQLSALSVQRTQTLMVKSTDVWLSEDKSKTVVTRNRSLYDTPLLRLIRRPLERILVKYSKVPDDIANIVRLESAADPWEKREMIMHNSIAKYMSCR